MKIFDYNKTRATILGEYDVIVYSNSNRIKKVYNTDDMGAPHGSNIEFDVNGFIVEYSKYEHGRRIRYKFRRSGDINITYYKTGEVKAVYQMNERHRKDGLYTKYSKSGHFIRTGMFKNGHKDGNWSYYNEKGERISVTNYHMRQIMWYVCGIDNINKWLGIVRN